MPTSPVDELGYTPSSLQDTPVTGGQRAAGHQGSGGLEEQGSTLALSSLTPSAVTGTGTTSPPSSFQPSHPRTGLGSQEPQTAPSADAEVSSLSVEYFGATGLGGRNRDRDVLTPVQYISPNDSSLVNPSPSQSQNRSHLQNGRTAHTATSLSPLSSTPSRSPPSGSPVVDPRGGGLGGSAAVHPLAPSRSGSTAVATPSGSRPLPESTYQSLGGMRTPAARRPPSADPSTAALHPALRSRYQTGADPSPQASREGSGAVPMHWGDSSSIVTEYIDSRMTYLEARFKSVRRSRESSPSENVACRNEMVQQQQRGGGPQALSTHPTYSMNSHPKVDPPTEAPYLNEDHRLVYPNRNPAIPESRRPAQAAARALASGKWRHGPSDTQQRRTGDAREERPQPVERAAPTSILLQTTRPTVERSESVAAPRRPASPASFTGGRGRTESATAASGRTRPSSAKGTSLFTQRRRTTSASSTTLSSGITSSATTPRYMSDRQGKFHVLDPSEIPTYCVLSPDFSPEMIGDEDITGRPRVPPATGPPRCATALPERLRVEAEAARRRRLLLASGHRPSSDRSSTTSGEGAAAARRTASAAAALGATSASARTRPTGAAAPPPLRHSPAKASSAPVLRWPFSIASGPPPAGKERTAPKYVPKVRPELAAPTEDSYRLRLLFPLQVPSLEDSEDERETEKKRAKPKKHSK